MYVVLAVLAACIVGVVLHFVLPNRSLRGAALAPGIASVVAAIVYTGMQWAGIGEDNVFLWLASVGGGIALAALGTSMITSMRVRSDAERKAALGI